jgi:hypothetical protein
MINELALFDEPMHFSHVAHFCLRYRSGNPGYITGLPLLFGPVQGNIVNMSDDGLLIPSLVSTQESGDCLSGQNQIMSALQFGHDIFSGCSAAFNRYLTCQTWSNNAIFTDVYCDNDVQICAQKFLRGKHQTDVS